MCANLLHGFERLHLQNESRCGGTKCRGSPDHFIRIAAKAPSRPLGVLLPGAGGGCPRTEPPPPPLSSPRVPNLARLLRMDHATGRRAARAGDGLQEELQPFHVEFSANTARHRRDVPPRARQTGNQPTLYRIPTTPHEDDGDRACRLLGRQGPRHSPRHEDLAGIWMAAIHPQGTRGIREESLTAGGNGYCGFDCNRSNASCAVLLTSSFSSRKACCSP